MVKIKNNAKTEETSIGPTQSSSVVGLDSSPLRENARARETVKKRKEETKEKGKKKQKNEMLTCGYKTPIKIGFQNTPLRIGNSPFLFFDLIKSQILFKTLHLGPAIIMF